MLQYDDLAAINGAMNWAAPARSGLGGTFRGATFMGRGGEGTLMRAIPSRWKSKAGGGDRLVSGGFAQHAR
jgi:hypothetical protein